MKKLSTLAFIAVAALVFGAFLSARGVEAQGTVNVATGKQYFMKYGCYECHGVNGQGNYGAGPAIAPHPIPYANLLAYVRAPRGDMPPFDEHVLPAAAAQNIYAYLESIPSSLPAGSIAVLKSVDFGNAGTPRTVSAEVARGHEVFGTYCLKCHVSAPIGPPLRNVKARMNLAATIAQIKNPASPMPKLFPAPLSERDVNDVAAYVQTL